ncbi:MAG TPA: hypothetical protein VIH97_06035 [Candidatus Acidoferrales bacterium]
MRSLNILLKFARMYDFGHPRTAKQYETAWQELRTALGTGTDNEAGVLLAVSGDQLLLDGTPLESAAAERSFARMLSAAGIASIHFAPQVTQTSLARFVRGFPISTGNKPTQLAEQLKSALQGDPHIHVNEVCFVPADSAVARSTVAAQIAAHTVGMSQEKTDELFNDPEKLLQLIMAAEGTKGNRGRGMGHGTGSGSGEGYGDGTGDGSGDGSGQGGGFGYGTGGERTSGGGAPGGYGSGAPESGQIFYAVENAEVIRDFPSNGVPGSDSPVYVEGSANLAQGPSAGSFAGGQPGAAGSSASAPSTWNIISDGGGDGTPLAPDAAGFWFNKDDAQGSSQATGRKIGKSSKGDNSISGVALTDQSGHEGGDGGSSHTRGRHGAVMGGTGHGYAPGVPLGEGTRTGSGARSDSGRRGPGGSSVRVWNATEGTAGEANGGGPGRWGNATAGIRGSRDARSGPGSMAVETGLMSIHEDELKGILQMLGQIARTTESPKDKLEAAAFQSRLSTLPRRARFTVSQALSALASQAPSEVADKPMLLKLAEHIAIRFAMESYEHGDIEVNAVRQVLDEMSTELDGLRKVLGVYEEKMARHGINVQSHVDVLAQQFWSQVPEEKRKSVLESSEAWCVPAVQVREYIEQLLAAGQKDDAEKVLTNYANCITSKSAATRRQTATGLAELAATYSKCDDRLLLSTIRQVGVQLAEEQDSELQSLVGAAFVRLSQEATNQRSYPAIQRAVELVDYVETERPGVGKNLRPRIGVENHLPEFLDEALKTGNVPSGLTDLLRRMPIAASQHVASRFSRSGFREDCDLLLGVMNTLGPEAVEHLREHLRTGEPNEAIQALGILVRVDSESVEQILPTRMSDWKRAAHDRVVRQIAASGSKDRGHLLLKIFDSLDPLVRPLAVDEIGMSGEQDADMRLLRLAEGDLPKDGTDYLRLKAIEALGRLRTPGAEAILRKIAEGRRAFRWASPGELRLVASQSMVKIDPEWVRAFVPRSGLSVAEFSIEPLDADPESPAIRQRRYPRLRLEQHVAATTTNLKENCLLDIPELALGGGVAICEQSLHPGSIVTLRLTTSQKPVKVQAIVRDANTQARAFEVVDMELEERAKLRKLLVQLGSVLKASTSKERARRAARTISSSSAV